MEMSLGKRIRELRTMKNLSQEAVAEKCNVSTPAVSHWETDSSSPNKAHRKLLADVLGVHENDLYVVPEAYTTGQLTIKANSDNVFQDQMCSMHQGVVTEVDGLKMVNISLLCDANAANAEKPQTLMLIIIGNN